MRRHLETVRARDAHGREYDIDVFAEPREISGGTVEWVGTASARIVGTRLNLPAVRVSLDVFHLSPGGLELIRVRS
jgi:hypothetical protein